MFPNLRAELARKNINGMQLAKALNISRKSVSNKMSGRTEFTRVEMFIIKQNLLPNCSIDYLFETKEKTA